MKDMIKNSLLVLIFSLGVLTMHCKAAVDIPDFESMSWNERTYKANLPDPFGKISIQVQNGENGQVESIWIKIHDKKNQIPLEQLAGIKSLGEPGIAIIKGKNSPSDGETFQILFEYGDPIRINIGSDSECSTHCHEWVRRVLIFTVNEMGKISVVKTIPGQEKASTGLSKSPDNQ